LDSILSLEKYESSIGIVGTAYEIRSKEFKKCGSLFATPIFICEGSDHAYVAISSQKEK